MKEQVKAILDFWFQDVMTNLESLNKCRSLWFGKNKTTDEYLREHFFGLLKQAALGKLDAWCQDEQSTLALIILLDQFSRNIFRDTEKMYVNDEKVLQICLQMIAKKMDLSLHPIQRFFAYMPLQHVEDKRLQALSVICFKDLAEMASEEWRGQLLHGLEYAIAHKEIIDRFGRFPHRNQLLNRRSTPEEIEFLKQPGSSF